MPDTDREHREQLLRLELRLADLARATAGVARQLEDLSREDPRCYSAHLRTAMAVMQLRLAHRDVAGPPLVK